MLGLSAVGGGTPATKSVKTWMPNYKNTQCIIINDLVLSVPLAVEMPDAVSTHTPHSTVWEHL